MTSPRSCTGGNSNFKIGILLGGRPPDIRFLGSDVESGTATAVVVHIGDQTYFGNI